MGGSPLARLLALLAWVLAALAGGPATADGGPGSDNEYARLGSGAGPGALYTGELPDTILTDGGVRAVLVLDGGFEDPRRRPPVLDLVVSPGRTRARADC